VQQSRHKDVKTFRGLLFLSGVVMRATIAPWLIALAVVVGLSPAIAQTRAPAAPAPAADAMNAGTIGIISGGADGTYIRIAADLAHVLDGDKLRILPIIGRGSLQNLRDIMFLRGVDIGIVQMDARDGLGDDRLQNDAKRRLRYIARLYNEELHILAPRSVTDLRQLDGQKVNIDRVGSGTSLTARILFDKLGIKPEFTHHDQATAHERLRSGEIKAALFVAGRPVRAIADFQSEGRFHLLPVPFERSVTESYLPVRFSSTDYPRLIDPGQAVDTIAIGNVLAVFNWPEGSERAQRVNRFVEAFFSRFEEFSLPGRHPKWKEVNLGASVPGWERYKPAQDWLDRQARLASASADDRRAFESFLDGRGAGTTQAGERERLFEEFLAWQQARARRRAGAAP
jgi:TRAP transporter TAXI family solute receptor